MSLPVLFVSLWRSHNLGDRPDPGCKFTERAWRCDSPHHLSLRAGSYKSLFIASVILSTLIPASQSQYLLEKKNNISLSPRYLANSRERNRAGGTEDRILQFTSPNGPDIRVSAVWRRRQAAAKSVPNRLKTSRALFKRKHESCYLISGFIHAADAKRRGLGWLGLVIVGVNAKWQGYV